MKKIGRLVVGLCFIGSSAFGQDYGLVQEQLFFGRSPSETQHGFSSDHRLRGMGGLSLPVEDPSNEIGAYAYLGFAAGLPLDYTDEGRLEGVLFSESGTLEDTDGADKGDILDAETRAGQVFTVAPIAAGGNGRSAFALGVRRESAESDYTSSALATMGLDSAKDEPSFGEFTAGFGHRIGDWVFGAGFSSAKDEAERFDGVSAGVPEFTHTTIEVSEMDLSAGHVWELGGDRRWTFLVGPLLNQGKVTMENDSPLKIEIDADGLGFQAGAVYGSPRTRVGIYAQSSQLEGDATLSGVNTTLDGDIDTSIFAARFRHRAESIPLSFGAEWRGSVLTWEVSHPTAGTLLDLEFTEGRLGVGAAWHFGEKGLLGFEAASIVEEDENNQNPADPDANEERKGVELTLGGEANLAGPWWLRAGYKMRTMEEDPAGSAPALDTKSGQASLGVEYKAAAFSVALTVTSAAVKFDGDAGLGLDALEHRPATGHLAFVYRFMPLGGGR